MTDQDFDEIKREFERDDCWGLSTSIDVFNCDPKKIRDEDTIWRYIDELCHLIEMIKYGKPIIVNFGLNERVNGYSFMQLIETSSITGHFANKTNNAYIDIFSCKLYNPIETAEFTHRFFDGSEVYMCYSCRK